MSSSPTTPRRPGGCAPIFQMSSYGSLSFCQAKLICYAWTFIHMSDVGGRVLGSIAPSSYELYQEGIRVPPQRLFRAGRLDETFLRMFLANTRTADQNWGDMKACLAGLNTAERRVHELLARFGTGRIEKGIDDVLGYAETQARRVIAHVPEGTYRFSDFIEADMVGPHCRAHQSRHDNRGRRNDARFHRHRAPGACRAQYSDVWKTRALDAHHGAGQLAVHAGTQHCL